MLRTDARARTNAIFADAARPTHRLPARGRQQHIGRGREGVQLGRPNSRTCTAIASFLVFFSFLFFVPFYCLPFHFCPPPPVLLALQLELFLPACGPVVLDAPLALAADECACPVLPFFCPKPFWFLSPFPPPLWLSRESLGLGLRANEREENASHRRRQQQAQPQHREEQRQHQIPLACVLLSSVVPLLYLPPLPWLAHADAAATAELDRGREGEREGREGRMGRLRSGPRESPPGEKGRAKTGESGSLVSPVWSGGMGT